MITIPTLKKITTLTGLQDYSDAYFKASNLPIPDSYLHNPDIQVFGIYSLDKLIGGFILGNCIKFRTVALFASKENQTDVLNQLGNLNDYTEICCFYIDRKYRSNTKFNFLIWLSMTYALKRYGRKKFLFGTCSRSLAYLYAKTPKSIPVHHDRINTKDTFIFKASRNTSIRGMLEIIAYKLKRTIRIRLNAKKIMTLRWF